jgi:hypothetical protein
MMEIYFINAFQNSDGEIILLPIKLDKGVSVGVDNVYHIVDISDAELLGAKLREVFEFCKDEAPDFPEVNLKQSIKGYKSFRKLTKDLLSLNAVWKPDKYVLRPQKRDQIVKEGFNY